MLEQEKKPGGPMSRRAKSDAMFVPEIAPEPAMTELLFYGASRFEQPEIGLVFVRDHLMYRLVAITKSERNYLRRFSQVWAFTALCERLPNRIH